MIETTRFALPFLSAGQAQKEVTHNEALSVIDRMLHPAVVTRALATPPPATAVAATFIVAAGGSGAWAGHSGELASFDGSGWIFATPVRGCLAWIVDEGAFAVFDTGWSTGGWPVAALRISGRQVFGVPPATVASPTGGSIIDVESRAAIAALIVTLKAQGIVL